MTIKQLGGVFGRNPTFNDVTIDGTLTFDGDIDISSDLKISGDLEVTGTSELDGNVAIGAGVTPTYPLTVEKDSDSWIAKIENIGSDADAQALLVRSGATAAHNAVIIGGYADGAYKMLLRSSGNLELLAGNLVIGTSGKGIDFSATGTGTGTSTSELFADYEEGVYTPEYTPASGAFGSITYDTAITGGKYTKVGNLVHIQGGIRTNAITVGSASGGIRLSGLPFPAIASGTGQDGWSALTVGQAVAFAGDVPSLGSIVAGQSYIELQYRSAANGATIDLDVADLDTGASDNLMRFSATYISG